MILNWLMIKLYRYCWSIIFKFNPSWREESCIKEKGIVVFLKVASLWMPRKVNSVGWYHWGKLGTSTYKYGLTKRVIMRFLWRASRTVSWSGGIVVNSSFKALSNVSTLRRDFLEAVGTHLLFRFIAGLELTPTDRQVFAMVPTTLRVEIRRFAYDTILARFEWETGA